MRTAAKTALPGSPPAGAEWTAAAARDRFSSTLFLVALFHSIIILGVTFSAGPRAGAAPTSLEVVLVTGHSRPEADPEARLLAQQNLAGGGNTSAATPLRTAPGQTQPAELAGPPRDGSEQPGEAPATASEINAAPVLATGMSNLRLAEPGTADLSPEMRQDLPASEASDIIARVDAQTLVQDRNARELVISANTRESRIAPYLSSWKRRVEHVGTLNFPHQARRRAGAPNPVLEVAISAEGQLREVAIMRSSGFRDLDQAAIDILRAAGPFQPFPETLRTEYDVLRFSYEWHFTEGLSAVRTAGGR